MNFIILSTKQLYSTQYVYSLFVVCVIYRLYLLNLRRLFKSYIFSKQTQQSAILCPLKQTDQISLQMKTMIKYFCDISEHFNFNEISTQQSSLFIFEFTECTMRILFVRFQYIQTLTAAKA